MCTGPRRKSSAPTHGSRAPDVRRSAAVDTAATVAQRTAGTSRLERVLVPVRYALRRLRLHAPQAVVAGLGIAIGAAVLALTQIASTAAQDRAVQRALAQLQPSDRVVQVVWSGVPAQSGLSLPQLDVLARAAVTPLIGTPPFRVAVFRQANWGGAFVNLGAVDGLGRWTTITQGRAPRSCTATRCELVQVGGAPVHPQLPGFAVVGRAIFKPGAPLAAYFGAGGEQRPPILVANGVLGFAAAPLPDAALIARTYGWIVPVAPRAVHDWELASLGDRIDAAQARLERRSDIFTVSGPTDTIRDIRVTSRVAAQRLLILGGDAAVLLLGFAVLAAARLRRDHADVRRRLTWAGATRAQVMLVAGTEAVLITLVATIAGWLAGAAAGGLLARHLGAPAGLAVQHALGAGRTLATAAGLAVVTALVMLVALRAGSIGIPDVAALGALGAVLLALARGKADASSLQDDGTGVLLLLLPGLVLFVLAVATARVLGPALRGLEWGARRAPAAVRVALLSLARAPGEVALAVVFFVVSVGVAVFAVSYRATLLQGERDQARYAVPAPYVLQEDLTKLKTVLEAAPTLPATRVLRDAGTITGVGDVTLLALPAAALARIDGWRSDFSSQPPAALARALQPTGAPRLAGVGIPRTFTATVTGDRLSVTLVVENRRGDFTQLDLGEHEAGTFTRTLPRLDGRVVAIRLGFPNVAAFIATHKENETQQGVNAASTGTIAIPRRFASWIGVAGARAGGPGVFDYTLNRANDTVIRPVEPNEGSPVPVIGSPGVRGLVNLRVADSVVTARVVATARYFPSLGREFVVADLPTWLVAANTAEPGVATPSELWMQRKPPPLPLQVTSQREQVRLLRDDPIARAAIALLSIVAIVGLVLAAAGLTLTVIGDRTGERASLRDLESLGATPRELRRHLLLRAGVVGTLGFAGGIAAGVGVGTLVVAIVTVTAGARSAVPPLALSFDWPVVALALGVTAVASALGALAASRR